MKVGLGWAINAMICAPIGIKPIPVNIPRLPKPQPPAVPYQKRTANEECPCKAWKLLDRFYTEHPEIHEDWRVPASRKKWSPYDYFMRINMRRFAYGLKGLYLPPPLGTFYTYLALEGTIDPPKECPANFLVAFKLNYRNQTLDYYNYDWRCATWDPNEMKSNVGMIVLDYMSLALNDWRLSCAVHLIKNEVQSVNILHEKPGLFRLWWGMTPDSLHMLYHFTPGPTWKGPMFHQVKRVTWWAMPFVA